MEGYKKKSLEASVMLTYAFQKDHSRSNSKERTSESEGMMGRGPHWGQWDHSVAAAAHVTEGSGLSHDHKYCEWRIVITLERHFGGKIYTICNQLCTKLKDWERKE